MTCIAGLVRDGRVYLAGDSALSNGQSVELVAEPKVWSSGPLVLGYAGGISVGMAIQYQWTPPKPPTSKTAAALWKYITGPIPTSLRALLKKHGIAEPPEFQPPEFQMLVGLRGHLYYFDEGMMPSEIQNYGAVGTGTEVAMGVLWYAVNRTKRLDPAKVVRDAVLAAEAHVTTVRGPVTNVAG